MKVILVRLVPVLMNDLHIVLLKQVLLLWLLLAALDGSVTAPAIADAKLKAGIAKVAADLKANSGAALVVSGSNDVNVQIIVNAINNAIGAYGKTIDWTVTSNYRQGIDKDLVDLVAQMEGGTSWCFVDRWC